MQIRRSYGKDRRYTDEQIEMFKEFMYDFNWLFHNGNIERRLGFARNIFSKMYIPRNTSEKGIYYNSPKDEDLDRFFSMIDNLKERVDEIRNSGKV